MRNTGLKQMATHYADRLEQLFSNTNHYDEYDVNRHRNLITVLLGEDTMLASCAAEMIDPGYERPEDYDNPPAWNPQFTPPTAPAALFLDPGADRYPEGTIVAHIVQPGGEQQDTWLFTDIVTLGDDLFFESTITNFATGEVHDADRGAAEMQQEWEDSRLYLPLLHDRIAGILAREE